MIEGRNEKSGNEKNLDFRRKNMRFQIVQPGALDTDHHRHSNIN